MNKFEWPEARFNTFLAFQLPTGPYLYLVEQEWVRWRDRWGIYSPVRGLRPLYKIRIYAK